MTITEKDLERFERLDTRPRAPASVEAGRAQDVREALEAAIGFIAAEYRDSSYEPEGEWLPPKVRQVYAKLVAALTSADEKGGAR